MSAPAPPPPSSSNGLIKNNAILNELTNNTSIPGMMVPKPGGLNMPGMAMSGVGMGGPGMAMSGMAMGGPGIAMPGLGKLSPESMEEVTEGKPISMVAKGVGATLFGARKPSSLKIRRPITNIAEGSKLIKNIGKSDDILTTFDLDTIGDDNDLKLKLQSIKNAYETEIKATPVNTEKVDTLKRLIGDYEEENKRRISIRQIITGMEAVMAPIKMFTEMTYREMVNIHNETIHPYLSRITNVAEHVMRHGLSGSGVPASRLPPSALKGVSNGLTEPSSGVGAVVAQGGRRGHRRATLRKRKAASTRRRRS